MLQLRLFLHPGALVYGPYLARVTLPKNQTLVIRPKLIFHGTVVEIQDKSFIIKI
jgi:hypothetical protein